MILFVILDEFDRLPTKSRLQTIFADTVKMLSDHAIRATLVLVGVADNIGDLIEEHQSVERALVQIRMPRMSPEELQDIVKKGLEQLGMAIEAEALSQIALLSQGLPHYTHLLGLHASREALEEGSRKISMANVDRGIEKALKQTQGTTQNSYRKAVMSHRRDNLYAQVLLACALARTDEIGSFAAADVRDPMSAIMGKPYDIPSFSRHLYDFAERERVPMLQKMGVERRFRFVNPLMQPYVTMQGFVSNLINRQMLGELSKKTAAKTATRQLR